MIDQIRVASTSLTTCSGMISKSVGNIQTSTTSNSEAATVMENSIAGLSKQIDLLDKEMSGFKI
jgi:methyl-accepting chemotaxis protein